MLPKAAWTTSVINFKTKNYIVGSWKTPFHYLNKFYFYRLNWDHCILFVRMYCHSCIIFNFMVEYLVQKTIRIKKYFINLYLIIHIIVFDFSNFKCKFGNGIKLFLQYNLVILILAVFRACTWSNRSILYYVLLENNRNRVKKVVWPFLTF